MSDEERETDGVTAGKETRRLARMLMGIARTARDASLTGQLAGGKTVAIRQYNAILTRLQGSGSVPPELFTPLPEGMSFDEVGVAATNLAHFLREDDEEEHRRRWRSGGGVFEASPGHVKIVGFPGHIGEVGEILREYLPDFVKHRVTEAVGEEMRRGRGVPPPPPPPPGVPRAPRWEEAERARTELARRLAEVDARLELMTEQIRQPDLPPEEVQRLAVELGRLGQEREALSREQARFREERGPDRHP